MKKKFFVAYGFVLWVPYKIAATVLMMISFFAGVGPIVQADDADIRVGPLQERAAVFIAAGPGLTGPEISDLPDPEPPTTDGPWADLVSSSP